MPVYVDPLYNYGGSAAFKWKNSCHMFADTEWELHVFAIRIGLKRSWFQDRRRGPRRFPHYDLNASRRRAAVKCGAIQLELRQARDKWIELGFLPKETSNAGTEMRDVRSDDKPVAATQAERSDIRSVRPNACADGIPM
jgi:hypothetical protein